MRLAAFLITASLTLSLWSSSPVLAMEVVDERPNNIFGGKTITFKSRDQGVREGIRYYDNGHTLMKEVLHYTEGKISISGIRTTSAEFILNAMVRKTVEYSSTDSLRRRITRVIYHYEQSSENLKKKETHFLEKHKGHNIIYYNLDQKTKLEWFYPLNKTGIQKLTHYYDKLGINIKSTEKFYTQKTQKKEGVVKTILFFDWEKVTRQEWYYTKKWAEGHLGIYKKLKAANLHPSQKLKDYTLFFDKNDQIIDPTTLTTKAISPLK